MKYYFITYQATNRQGSVSIWNEVIDQSPMSFIKEFIDDKYYYNYVVINTCEISEDEFNTYKGKF